MEDNTPSFSIIEINKAIDAMARAQNGVNKTVARVLVMAVFASIVGIEKDHVGVANAMLANLRTSTKRQGIVAFVEKYGQLYMAAGAKKFSHFTLGEQGKLVWDAEYSAKVQLAADSWETFKPETEESDFDVEAKIRKILSDAAKRQKSGKAVLHADILADLPSVLAKHTALVG